MIENIDNDAATVTATPQRSVTQWARDSAAWLVFASFLLLAIGGLIVTLASDPLQITVPKNFEQTVPRKVVIVPDAHSDIIPLIQTVPIQTPVTLPPPVVVHPAIIKTPLSVIATVAKPLPAAPIMLPDHHVAHFKTPVIAIVIDDMGLDQRHSAQIVNLPGAITLAFMPYAQHIEKQAAQAQNNGHELIVHMPMEPDDLAHNNPGPDALLIKNGETENVRRLDKNLAAFTGFIGINNHMGSALTADRASITPVLQDIKQRGLWFLDSKTDARSVAATVANEIGLPFAARDVFLDNTNNREAVLKQLRETEQIAARKGYAIAIGHSKEGTVTALQDWIRDVQARGFLLVPLSTIIAARFPTAVVPRYARLNTARLAQQ